MLVVMVARLPSMELESLVIRALRASICPAVADIIGVDPLELMA